MPFAPIALLLGLLAGPVPAAQAASASLQDHGALRQQVESFLLAQSASHPGRVAVAVGAIDPRLKLPRCAALQAFLPPGSRAWGKTSVGVRCTAPAAWTLYVQATVQVFGDYLVAAVPLAPGQVIAAADLTRQPGDLARLPPGTLTDPAQALGRAVTLALPAGAPLRQDLLKLLPLVKQGQKVVLSARGSGFVVSAEGQALGPAAAGQAVSVKLANGQVVGGIARAEGEVEVVF